MMVTLRQTTYLLALLIMIGFILHIGKPVLLPVLIAVISVYILFDVTARLGQVPLIGLLPSILRPLRGWVGPWRNLGQRHLNRFFVCVSARTKVPTLKRCLRVFMSQKTTRLYIRLVIQAGSLITQN